MKLSVIIPTYKRHTDLNRLLNSLYEQTSKPEQVVIIVGPGDIESINIAITWQEKIDSIQIIQSEKASVVHALNLGLASVENEVVCMLDDDACLPVDWAFKIKSAFKNDPTLGAYGGRDIIQLDEPELSQPSLASSVGVFKWNGTQIGNHHCGAKHSPVQVDMLKGVNLSFRRCTLTNLQIEPALESQGAEVSWEIDITQRIARSGFKVVYDNNNFVYHYVAPRLLFDDRSSLFSPAWPTRIFNQALVVAKFRPFYEVLFYVIRTFILGSRKQPGVALSILLINKYGLNVLRLPWRNLIFLLKGSIHGFYRRKFFIDTVGSTENLAIQFTFYLLFIN